jgi:hypothetical protein
MTLQATLHDAWRGREGSISLTMGSEKFATWLVAMDLSIYIYFSCLLGGMLKSPSAYRLLHLESFDFETSTILKREGFDGH